MDDRGGQRPAALWTSVGATRPFVACSNWKTKGLQIRISELSNLKDKPTKKSAIGKRTLLVVTS